MKKTIAILALLLFCTACGNQAEPNTPTSLAQTESTSREITQETSPTAQETLPPAEEWPEGYGEPEPKQYRPIYYSMSRFHIDLVDRKTYSEWQMNRVENNREQYENECIAVSFIREFNISKEDFARANEEVRKRLTEMGVSPEDLCDYELYPVDLIYTFNNEKINEFFLWEGSIYAHEAGLAPSPWPKVRPPEEELNPIRERLAKLWKERAEKLTQEALAAQ